MSLCWGFSEDQPLGCHVRFPKIHKNSSEVRMVLPVTCPPLHICETATCPHSGLVSRESFVSGLVKKAKHRRIDAFETVVLEKTLESPLDCKETQPVLSEGDQPWDFFGRTDAKAETPVLWPPHVKS